MKQTHGRESELYDIRFPPRQFQFEAGAPFQTSFCVYTAAAPALWPANWMNVGPTNCSASTKNQEPYQSKAGDQHKRDVMTWLFSGAGRWKSKLDLN